GNSYRPSALRNEGSAAQVEFRDAEFAPGDSGGRARLRHYWKDRGQHPWNYSGPRGLKNPPRRRSQGRFHQFRFPYRFAGGHDAETTAEPKWLECRLPGSPEIRAI